MKTKTASKLPLQQMIANVISHATEKVAADETEKKKKVQNLLAYEKKEHGHIPTPSEEEQEKTASARGMSEDYITKLAASVEYIAEHLDSLEFPQRGVLQKAAEEAGSPAGAGKGPGALEVSQAIGGTQAVSKAHSRTHNAAASQAGAPLSAAHEGDSKTQLENDMHHAPGGGNVAPTARYPEKGPLVASPSSKLASARSVLQRAVLQKLAGEDVMKSNISAERSANPLAGMGQLETTDATQSSPHQAGDHGGGFGNQARRLIASNQAAIDATKGDAKGPVKTQLSEVLEEPALTSSTDSVLGDNLRNTGKAGVKIAATRAALQKVAQQGCKCQTIDGECAFCKLKEKVAGVTKSKHGSSKVADAMGGYGGAPGGGAAPGMGGGSGMTPMADAGAGADGCTCGATGECRVCKLKAALAAAKAQGGGGPLMGGPAAAPMDPGGAGPAGAY